MFPQSLPATTSWLSFKSLPDYFILLIVLTVLPGFCVAKPLTQPAEGQAAHSHKAAYNKPYKIKRKTYFPMHSAAGYQAKGTACWYGSESGTRTASGAVFNPKGLTAAHKTLPIPSKVRVTNLRNGRYIDVVVNDRGPFIDNRLIDLSHGAAKQIDLRGLTEVKIEYLGNQYGS